MSAGDGLVATGDHIVAVSSTADATEVMPNYDELYGQGTTTGYGGDSQRETRL